MTAALLGEGADQKSGWGELLKEAAEAAAGELLAGPGSNAASTGLKRLRDARP